MYRHRFDPIAFVFGVAFVAIALLVGLPDEPWSFIVNDLALGWLWPVLLMAVGLTILVPALRSRNEGVPGEMDDRQREPVNSDTSRDFRSHSGRDSET